MAKNFVPSKNTQCIGTPDHPWNTAYISNNIYSNITDGIVFEATIENILYQIGWDNTNKLFYKLIDGVRTDIKDPTLLPSGRKLYRHATLPGSVIVFNDMGTERKVLVLDADYRIPSYGNNTSPVDAGITAVTMPTTLPIYPTDDSATVYTDDIINNEIIKDTQTSKQLTDKLMAAENLDTEGIAHKCRAITLSNGQSCDCPNINTLIRIAILASRIDSLDPTLSGNWSLVDTFQTSLEEIPPIDPIESVSENSVTPRAWSAFMGVISSSQGTNKYPLAILTESEGYRPYNCAQLWYGNLVPILELTE